MSKKNLWDRRIIDNTIISIRNVFNLMYRNWNLFLSLREGESKTELQNFKSLKRFFKTLGTHCILFYSLIREFTKENVHLNPWVSDQLAVDENFSCDLKGYCSLNLKRNGEAKLKRASRFTLMTYLKKTDTHKPWNSTKLLRLVREVSTRKSCYNVDEFRENGKQGVTIAQRPVGKCWWLFWLSIMVSIDYSHYAYSLFQESRQDTGKTGFISIYALKLNSKTISGLLW